jgi:ubiquinone/menaquinone biosynthesis C-methylase UbiE
VKGPTLSDESDRTLRAYQTAFRPELEAAVRSYDLADDARVLDSPCGDGFYTDLFARHQRAGTLVAADLSDGCLARARAAVRPASSRLAVEFVRADAYKLPFDDHSFDLVWCAQSFITLDEPVRALRELARVVRPGGRVAVLETDEYHHVLLPWPIALELAVQRAVREESRVRYGTGGKFAQARRLRAGFLEAGLTPTGRRTVVADRAAPFAGADREFLVRHLADLKEFVRHELTPREMVDLELATDPDGPDSLLNRADVELTCLATISHATKG